MSGPRGDSGSRLGSWLRWDSQRCSGRDCWGRRRWMRSRGPGVGRLLMRGCRVCRLSPVGLHPSVFVASDKDYEAWAPYSVSWVQVTATARYGAESLTVNGTAATSGQASGPVALAVGSNLITVVATSSGREGVGELHDQR